MLETFEERLRKCYRCHKPLFFGEFTSSNSQLSLRDAELLWNSPYIELYCCLCYKTSPQTNNYTTQHCPECGGTFITDTYHKVCNECGLVTDDIAYSFFDRDT